MPNSKFLSIFAFLLSVVIIVSPAYAKKSKIKGDPELVWLSPLGSGDIENNAYNRCRLIRTLKPGKEEVSATTKNTFDILSTYAPNLYAQAIKVGGYIEAEKEKQLNFETRKEYYTGDVYIEQVAREQLGMVKPNEIIYINRSE